MKEVKGCKFNFFNSVYIEKSAFTRLHPRHPIHFAFFISPGCAAPFFGHDFPTLSAIEALPCRAAVGQGFEQVAVAEFFVFADMHKANAFFVGSRTS